LVGAELGTAVEAALFQHHAAAGNTTKYIAQWRDIMANLKDEKNDLKSVPNTEREICDFSILRRFTLQDRGSQALFCLLPTSSGPV
jgi:hypothetical protein